ncbi:hypothetical protein AB0C86_01285 [Streptomyces lavendulae]|uniref:hypothetical protein n=1 Tax=Streptomyces lavendulae TaxID=1914 RepID=UPI0033C52D50
MAHAVLDGAAEPGGAVVPLGDVWGREAERPQERLRAAGSWPERFEIADAALARRYEAGRTVDPAYLAKV